MNKRRDQEPGGVGSTKPYLIRALYEWCVDQNLTPYLSVAVDPYTQVPKAYIKEGQIVLNLSPEAVHQLVLGNEYITCSARFGGVAQSVSVPVGRVSALYARENGNGMAFEIEDTPELEAENDGEHESKADRKILATAPALSDGKDAHKPGTAGDTVETEPPKPGPSKPGGRPHLTRVK